MAQIPHGVVWLVTFILIEAAVIDGKQLRVPNWLTLHMVLGGLGYAYWVGRAPALLWSLEGAALGLALLLPLYAIGGMGAGDVKLLAGVGAFMGPLATFWAFTASAVVGGMMGLAMIAWSGEYVKHLALFHTIGHEILTLRDPAKLAALAAERKPRMTLLPYGIPIAVGSIGYFAWAGLFC